MRLPGPFCGAVVFVLLAASAMAQLPWQALKFLKPVGQMDLAVVPECSGMVQSLRYPGVFWVLSDSGSPEEIVPVTAEGKLARGWSGPVRVEGVRNYDWEDLALDDRGNLIIADLGNNSGKRKQLMLHFVPEPKPGGRSVRTTRTLRVHFEDQKTVTPDFDCEAVFVAGGKIYVLTKRRSDKFTHLYRLEGESISRSNPLRKVDAFEVGGMVTAADTSPNGRRVAVLTYTALWVFDYDAKSGSIFRKSVRWMPVLAWQAEGVAWDGNDTLVIANEGGQLYRVGLAGMEVVRP
jgi:hypothetical protein